MNNHTGLKKILIAVLIIGGAIGLFASFLITIEKIELIKNPDYIPPCSINPLFNCGSVMKTPQAEAFGFPNPLIGLAGFAIVITIGMALLAGATFRRWFWQWMSAGTLFAVSFIYWLAFQSIFQIQTLCLYCMVVWTVTIPIFVYTIAYCAEAGHIRLSKTLAVFCQRYHLIILAIAYLAIIASILVSFWDY